MGYLNPNSTLYNANGAAYYRSAFISLRPLCLFSACVPLDFYCLRACSLKFASLANPDNSTALIQLEVQTNPDGPLATSTLMFFCADYSPCCCCCAAFIDTTRGVLDSFTAQYQAQGACFRTIVRLIACVIVQGLVSICGAARFRTSTSKTSSWASSQRTRSFCLCFCCPFSDLFVRVCRFMGATVAVVIVLIGNTLHVLLCVACHSCCRCDVSIRVFPASSDRYDHAGNRLHLRPSVSSLFLFCLLFVLVLRLFV